MTITIDDSKLNGLNSIVSELNAVENAVQITPEEYITQRVYDILSSYDAQLIEKAKREYESFITLAAQLPDDKKAEAIAFVQQLASSK